MYDYNSSNARKFDYTQRKYREYTKQAHSSENTLIKNSPAQSSKTITAPKESQLIKTVKRLFYVTVCFMLAFFVVEGYVAINEADNHINELSKDLRMVQAENQAIKAKIDKSIDLKNLQMLANDKFGMIRPENYQIFYINLNSGDYSENIAEDKSHEEEKSVPVEGVTGVLISSADMFK